MYLINELIALLALNMILMQALGTSTLFIAAGNRRSLVATALVITFFTTAGSAAAYGINRLLQERYSSLTLLFYTLAVGILYVLLLTLMYFVSGENFPERRKYIHVSAFNCAVMGTLFTVSGKAAETGQPAGLLGFAYEGALAGAGFVIAALILTAAFRKLNSAKVPASFRGFPAMLVYLGIISMAVYSLK